MKKRLTSLLVCIIMLAFFASESFAQDAAAVYTLSLQDAINMALEKDPAYESADIKITDAQRQLKEARKKYEDNKSVPVRISSGITAFQLQRGFFVEQAAVGVESAKLEKEQTIASNSYAITRQYYGVKQAERVLESCEEAYEIALNNYNAIMQQYSLGLVSLLDVNNAKYTLNQARAACGKYKRSLSLAQKSLAAAIFIEEDDFILNLTDDIEYIEFETNLLEDTQKAMETRYDVYMLKSALTLAQKTENIARAFGYDSATYSSAQQSMVQSEVTYNNTKKLIAISVNSSYNEILDAKDSLMLAEENLALREQEYNIMQIQFQLGMVTNIQLTGAMNSVTSAKIELENAKLTYKLAVEKYRYETTIGLRQ